MRVGGSVEWCIIGRVSWQRDGLIYSQCNFWLIDESSSRQNCQKDGRINCDFLRSGLGGSLSFGVFVICLCQTEQFKWTIFNCGNLTSSWQIRSHPICIRTAELVQYAVVLRLVSL